MKKARPDFSIENTYSSNVIGIDEVGRGALAGPVVAAAAVAKNKDFDFRGITDSKLLSKLKREGLVEYIYENFEIGIGVIDVETIDEINILQSTFKAMRAALANLTPNNLPILVDGNQIPSGFINTKAVIKGDQKSITIAAASIIAKVYRDKLMSELSEQFPDYKWHSNAGYGSKEHCDAILKIGPTKHHRKTFISKLLTKQLQLV